ncbi:MAG: hypothetical protein HYU58_13945 [Proteobacteria bacterium]|nr:hypothetical protein [Pseudomonadota bacterium]
MIVVVATLAEAEAAIARHPADDLELWSPEDAAQIHGVLWFSMLQQALRAAAPDREPRLVLDCGNRGDLAVEALRLGLQHVALRAAPDVMTKIADIAAARGARVVTGRPIFP